MTGNFTLFGAATVAGAEWCALYAAGMPLGALLVSHVTWDIWIFLPPADRAHPAGAGPGLARVVSDRLTGLRTGPTIRSVQTPTGRDAPAAGVALPTGTVTFLFTDIEGSTKLVERLGTAAWTTLLEAHQAIIRAALAAATGVEVKTEGDSFFAVFASAETAVAAAVAMQRALHAYDWPADAAVRVRMGLHTGEGVIAPDADYVGLDVHRAARVASAAHGGQVVLSDTTRALVTGALPDGATLRDLGEHRLKDLSRPERISQLVISGVPDEFPPLRTLDATPNNLPVMLTDFIGREAVLAEAHRLLDGTRLLTLTGPGGTGKTRLSLQLAADVAERFPDGLYFVALEPISDPALGAVHDRHGHGCAGRGRLVGGGSPARLPAHRAPCCSCSTTWSRSPARRPSWATSCGRRPA